jgi:hypothetical protein
LNSANLTQRCMLQAMLVLSVVLPAVAPAQELAAKVDDAARASVLFAEQVTPQLAMPATVLADYTARLDAVLGGDGAAPAQPQFLLLVDRSALVQAALLLWGAAGQGWRLVGAVPVSTGLPGKFEHFLTPLGVFAHSTDNPDFRAEGTKNKLGFRGYGSKGMRIYDLGWVAAPRGWGDGAMGVLRLQMHATDPQLAEPRLGTPQSEGCIRIPATFNHFLDMNGLLDADYDLPLPDGAKRWVLDPHRTSVGSAGRSIVVVDSGATERPAWSPAPGVLR